MPEQGHLFIRYGHIDNLDGWVTALHSRIQTRVSQLLGREVRIYRDLKLDGAEALWDVLRDRASRAQVFVAILSPRYLTSGLRKGNPVVPRRHQTPKP